MTSVGNVGLTSRARGGTIGRCRLTERTTGRARPPRRWLASDGMSYPARHRHQDRHKARKSVVPVILAIGILLASGIVGAAYLLKSPAPSKVLFGIGPEADSARQ